MAKKPAPPKLIETYRHQGEWHPNIPCTEFEGVVREDDRQSV
jgi:hypothetical protein